MTNEVLQAILSRRSCKKYKADPVPAEIIDAVIEAGLYAANGMVWEPEIEYYCRWSMQLDLYMKYKLFADDIRNATESVKNDKPGPRSLLDMVKTDDNGLFCFDEVVRVYTESGRKPDEKKVRNMLSQWKSRGFILQMTDDSFKKNNKH